MNDVNVRFRRLIGRFGVAVRACPDLTARDKVVAAAMMDRLDRGAFAQTGQLMTWDQVGVDALANDTAMCRRDVERARSALRAQGIIEPVGRPAKDRPARYRFCQDWLERRTAPTLDAAIAEVEAATHDSGVGDTGVIRAAERVTPEGSTCDSESGQRVTPVSDKPCNNLGINLARANARESGAGLMARLAVHFQRTELSWFRGAALELDGSGAVFWVPEPYQRDWINTHFAERLRTALGVWELEVRVGIPAIPPSIPRPVLHTIAGGRA
ncbi:hypothetical protein [Azospirillum sp. sgz302134]